MRQKFKITVFFIFLLSLFWGNNSYAFDPLEKLKNIKDTAVGLGENLFKKEKKLPKTIAVLPATGEGEEQDKIEIRTTFSNHIAYKNYEQIKLNDVDTKLHLIEKETGKKITELSFQEIGKAVNADGLIYIQILGIEKIYAALYASLTLKLKVKLINAETGELIWEKEDSVTERSGGVPLSPWGAISTAVSSALVLRESVKVAITDKLCRSLAKEMPEPKVAKVKRPPAIFSVLTNALDSPFKSQDEVLVSLQGEEGQVAYFDIGDVKKATQLIEIKPGEYVGKYVVKDGDEWSNQTIIAYLYNAKDKLEARYVVAKSITADTIPPVPVSDIKVNIRKDGFVLSWKAPDDEDLKDYVIHKASVTNPDFVEIASVSVPEYKDDDIVFGQKYYYRIYARDKAKNLSKFTEITKIAVKHGPTYLTGEIKENTIFYSVGSPYIIKGNLELQKGVTLSVEEGSVIEFEKDAQFIISGNVQMQGKKDSIITVKGNDYSIILKDTVKDAFTAEHVYFLGGRRFVISNAFAKFSNASFDDFDNAINLERNSFLEVTDSVFRRNKHTFRLKDSTLVLKNVDVTASENAFDIAGASKVTVNSVKLLNNNMLIQSKSSVVLDDVEVSVKQDLDLIRKIKGDVEIKKLKPFGKNFKNVKKEFLESLKKELAIALVKDNISEALKKTQLIEELSPEITNELCDIIAYVYFKNGDEIKANEVLKAGTAKAATYLKQFMNNQDKSDVGIKFADVKIALGSSLDGVDRASITKAKWRAVKIFAEERINNLSRDNMAKLTDKVIPKSSEYTLAVLPIFVEMGDIRHDGYYMVFLDTKKIMSDLKELKLLGDVVMETKIGIVDCTGLGITKNILSSSLKKLNFNFTEYGTGSCEPSTYYDRAKDKGIDVILTITEVAKVAPSLLGGNLKNIQSSLEIKAYDSFLAKPIFSLVKGTNIYHINDEIGKDLALKNAADMILERFEREMLNIEKSFTEDEIRKRTVKAFYAEKHLLPIEIKVAKAEPIFANNYKVYSEKPFIEILISNNTSRDFQKLKVMLMVKEFMDFPTEVSVDKLESLKTTTVRMKGVFNNKLLELTENSTLQFDIKVKYVRDGVEKEANLTYPVQVYEKHALVWDDRTKIAIYITPKDPVIVDFSRAVLKDAKDKVISNNISIVAAVFEAMRAIGTVYQQDPNNPYQIVSEKVDTIDFVQYARETLKRKAGDCDDLVSLFLSVLESLGIKTAAIDYPGHILGMFDTGISKDDFENLGLSRDRVVFYENSVYLPVEMTLLTENFYAAWQKGAKNYTENLGKGLKIISIENAWQTYKPATLPPLELSVHIPANFKDFYTDTINQLVAKRNEVIIKKIQSGALKPENVVYTIFHNSSANDAIAVGKFLLSRGIDDANLLNDLGNVYFVEKRYVEAIKSYKKAVEKESDNPFYISNLILALKKTQKTSEISSYKSKIESIAPFLKEE